MSSNNKQHQPAFHLNMQIVLKATQSEQTMKTQLKPIIRKTLEGRAIIKFTGWSMILNHYRMKLSVYKIPRLEWSFKKVLMESTNGFKNWEALYETWPHASNKRNSEPIFQFNSIHLYRLYDAL